MNQQMMELAKSPAAAQIAKNYTEKGSTYGPQFPLGSNPGDPTAVANVLPDADAAVPRAVARHAPHQPDGLRGGVGRRRFFASGLGSSSLGGAAASLSDSESSNMFWLAGALR